MSELNYPQEQWKAIPGYEGRYSISNFGRIKSFRKNGTSIIRKPGLSKTTGYLKVTVQSKETKRLVNLVIHRLVIKAFVPNPSGKPCANHKDGNKTNNHCSNLEWCTISENRIHYLHVTTKDRKCTLSEQQVQSIRHRSANGESRKSLSTCFKVSSVSIWKIITRRSWSHI